MIGSARHTTPCLLSDGDLSAMETVFLERNYETTA